MDKDILETIKQLSNNKKVQELLVKTVGLILLKQDNAEEFIKENNEIISHIRDWINSVVENNETWKNPRVLTIDALNNASNKYFEKKNNKLQTIELDEKHERLIAKLDDYYVVQMLTPEALDNESKQMQHCIGHGGYDKNLKYEEYKYLSLRDKFNKAHVTLEIEGREVIQLQGKQNRIPELNYLKSVILWLINSQYMINYNKYGFIYNKADEKIHFIHEIPDNCEIDGNLELNAINFSGKSVKIFKIPNNLTINGDLFLYHQEIEDIPANLVVNGDLYMKYCENLKKINKNIKVGGKIYFNNVSFEQNILPDDLFENDEVSITNLIEFLMKNNFDLDLSKFDFIFNKNDEKIYPIYNMPENCRVKKIYFKGMGGDIDYIPKGLTVEGNLDLNSKRILELPEKLHVFGNVDLSYSELRKILSDVVIDGNLDISNCLIETLPDDLYVGGDLDVNSSKLKVFPENIKIGKDINLSYTLIEKLPDNLTVHGDLNLHRCNNLTQLPKGLVVEKDLSLDKIKIKQLPEDLIVKRNIFLTETLIEKLPDNLVVNGTLDLTDCKNIKKLPKGLVVNNDLNIGRSSIEEIPEDIFIKNGFYIYENQNIKKLPKKLKCDIIYIDEEQIDLIDEEKEFRGIYVNSEYYKREDFFKEKKELSFS